MKTNYKIGETIRSIKPGLLFGFEGDILSINTDNKRPLTAISKTAGSWSFEFSEVEPIDSNNADKQLDALNGTYKPSKAKDSGIMPKEKKVPITRHKAATNGGSTIIIEQGAKNSIENLQVATKTAKRGRKPKEKVKDEKPKRKYQKRIKAEN